MVESIYTIPLTEAMDENCDCIFCYLEERIEKEQIEYVLGPAMMEPDFRILSNEKGYCRHHIGMMAAKKRALPLALVLDTRCDEVLKRLKQEDDSFKKRGFFKKEKSLKDALENLTTTCLVCERIEKTMQKFINTFWYLYDKEPEFRQRFLDGKGVCLPHFAKLISHGAYGAKKNIYEKELYNLEMKILQHEKSEVHGYTKQFDYRSDKENWTVKKDAHLNCAKRLSGRFERE